ncbi:hypothetical protein Q9233_012146 [Columba guinea]|nr:hypothetical protein Q9233_012146 [Columba guinea]
MPVRPNVLRHLPGARGGAAVLPDYGVPQLQAGLVPSGLHPDNLPGRLVLALQICTRGTAAETPACASVLKAGSRQKKRVITTKYKEGKLSTGTLENKDTSYVYLALQSVAHQFPCNPIQ